MRYALMTEPQQGYSYQDILDAANAAKAAGFETYFRSDHYSSFPGEEGQPATDCWTTLAGLARDTEGIGLGSMVSPVTFRIPGSYAKVVATVIDMAEGTTIEMGIGAGWNEEEHAALGIPYPDTVERVDRVEEQLAIVNGLWDEPDGWSYEGEHYQVKNAIFRPRGPRPNVIVGGVGRPRSCRLGAQYANEYNISSSNPAEVREINAKLDAACEKLGRDPATLTRSVMAGVLVGRDRAGTGRTPYPAGRRLRWRRRRCRGVAGGAQGPLDRGHARRGQVHDRGLCRDWRRPPAVPGLPAPGSRPHRRHGRAVRLRPPREPSFAA